MILDYLRTRVFSLSSALFAEKRLEDIKRELDKEKDAAIAEALRRAEEQAQSTAHRLQVHCRVFKRGLLMSIASAVGAQLDFSGCSAIVSQVEAEEHLKNAESSYRAQLETEVRKC